MAAVELRERLGSLRGWLSEEEGETLYRLARGCTGRGVIVEIGSSRGRSTTCLGLGSKDGARAPVYAIDLHRKRTFPEFERNMAAAALTDIVTPIRGRSQVVWKEFSEPIELLFIDGAHEYELVREDFDRWVPKVLTGGVVALHDTTWNEGPKRVADELVFRSRHFRGARYVFSSMTVAVKVDENTFAERLSNRYGLAVKRSVELTRRVVDKDRLPAPLQRLGRGILRRLP